MILVRTTDPNISLSGDPYEAVFAFGAPANVDTVVVDGRILRRAGKFTALDHADIVGKAREAASGLREKAKFPN